MLSTRIPRFLILPMALCLFFMMSTSALAFKVIQPGTKCGSTFTSTNLNLTDLDRMEIAKIQAVVDEIHHPIVVVGSAARGSRRNRHSSFPVGKRNQLNTKSDIDYVLLARKGTVTQVLESALYEFKSALDTLPDVGWHGILVGAPKLNGPRVLFRPMMEPLYLSPGSDAIELRISLPEAETP